MSPSSTAARTAPSRSVLPSGIPIRMLSRSGSLNSRGTCDVYAERGGTKNAARSGTRSPFHRTSPPSLGSSPSSTRSSVVLPEPTLPVTTVNEPRGTRSPTSWIPRLSLS